MITHASEYELLNKLNAINSDIEVADANDLAQLVSERERNLAKAHYKGARIYNTRSREF